MMNKEKKTDDTLKSSDKKNDIYDNQYNSSKNGQKKHTALEKSINSYKIPDNNSTYQQNLKSQESRNGKGL